MPLVGVPGLGFHTERAQHANAAHAQQPLLSQPHCRPARIQSRQQRPIVGVIFFQIRIEQIHRYPSNLHAPRTNMDIATKRVDGHEMSRAILARERHQRDPVERDGIGRVLLPAVGPDSLIEIAVTIQDAHRDHGDAEVGRSLKMVTGEDPETA